MIEPRDFSHLTRFPGEHGNPFDVILHQLEKIQRIPSALFFLALLIFSLIINRFLLVDSAVLLLFFLLDWLMIASLPILKLSFGPDKPVVTILAFLRAPFALLPPAINVLFQMAGTGLILFAFFFEPFRLVISRKSLPTPKLPAGSCIRVAHLGDLHLERITRRERTILQALDQEKPDLILFSGDILNLSFLRDSQAHAAARDFFSALTAPLGVFLVGGSPAVDLPELLPVLLKDLPLRWLRGETVSIPVGENEICIIGFPCSHRPHEDEKVLSDLAKDIHSNSLKLLLYHSPDLAPQAAALGIDIQLSGHTHGGQFRIPGLGALFTGSLYGRVFQSGQYQLGKMVLYITRGIGMEGAAAPRMRFFCPPEITIWEMFSDKIIPGE